MDVVFSFHLIYNDIGGSMAGMITHSFFALDTLKNKHIDFKTLKICSCGPDIFYAKNRSYGRLMHRKKVNLFFENYVRYIIEHDLKDNISVMSSLYGFISHYVLDTHIHPFVFYKTGVYNKKKKETYKYLDLHSKMENYIDMYVSEEHGYHFNKFKAHLFLFGNKTLDREVIKLLNDVLYDTYNIKDGGKKYQKGINSYYWNYKLFRVDLFGIKKGLYKIVDFFRKGKPQLSIYSHYKRENMDINLEHKVWYHPSTKEKMSLSIPDILNNSQKEYLRLIGVVDSIIYNNLDISNIKEFKNLSYINGCPIEDKQYIRYYE